ncbi:hypothetical protein PM082_020845 [Marasmius tenuissimus]|nr:hypothetical protein PM082_020845 [Marasmius tenuissimus]
MLLSPRLPSFLVHGVARGELSGRIMVVCSDQLSKHTTNDLLTGWAAFCMLFTRRSLWSGIGVSWPCGWRNLMTSITF